MICNEDGRSLLHVAAASGQAEGEELRKQIGASYYIECSSKTQQNVKAVFDAAIRVVIKPPQKKKEKKKKIEKGMFTKEIVPLNAGNVLGAEDNGPARKWLALIRKTLNSLPGTSGSAGCYTPSPIPDPIVELDAGFEGSTRQKASSFFHRRSFQSFSPQYENGQ